MVTEECMVIVNAFGIVVGDASYGDKGVSSRDIMVIVTNSNSGGVSGGGSDWWIYGGSWWRLCFDDNIYL